MKKVAIIGYGYVGKGMHKIFPDAMIYEPKFFKKENNVDIIDIKAVKEAGLDIAYTIEQINAMAGMAIVCVPTPPKNNSGNQFAENMEGLEEVDTSIVEETIKNLNSNIPVLIKSTIPPGTTDRLNNIRSTRLVENPESVEAAKKNNNICFSPEYMGEGGYYTPPKYPDPKDPRKHDFMIVGGNKKVCEEILSYFIPKLGPTKTYYIVDAVEAELIKYMENTWGAMKVIFCNEWFDICEKFGGSYERVREGWALDSRVEKMHTAVFRNKRGFGGKCYPKDLMGIIKASSDKGYKPKLLDTVWKVNKEMVYKNKLSGTTLTDN